MIFIYPKAPGRNVGRTPSIASQLGRLMSAFPKKVLSNLYSRNTRKKIVYISINKFGSVFNKKKNKHEKKTNMEYQKVVKLKCCISMQPTASTFCISCDWKEMKGKAVIGQRYPCPAWVVCDLSWRGSGQRPQRERGPVEHRGNLSVLLSICQLSIRLFFYLPSFCPGCPLIQTIIEFYGKLTEREQNARFPLSNMKNDKS